MEEVEGVPSRRRCSRDVLFDQLAKIAETSSNSSEELYLPLTEEIADGNVLMPDSWNVVVIYSSYDTFKLFCPDSKNSLVCFHSFMIDNFPDHAGLFVLQSKLFLIGGSIGYSNRTSWLLDIFVYDLSKKDAFRRCGKLLAPKDDPKIVHVDGKLYILACSRDWWNETDVGPIFECFDITSGSSSQLPDPPVSIGGRHKISIYFVFRRTLYVEFGAYGTICSFDLDENKWHNHKFTKPNVVKHLVGEYRYLSDCVYQGKVYLLRNCCTAKVCVYDLENPRHDENAFDYEGDTNVCCNKSKLLGKNCLPHIVRGKKLDTVLSMLPSRINFGKVVCVDEKSNKFCVISPFKDRVSHKDSILMCDFEVVKEDDVSGSYILRAKNVTSRTFTCHEDSKGKPYMYTRF